MKRRGRLIMASIASLVLMSGCQDVADNRTGDALHQDRRARTARYEYLQKVAADLNELEQYVAAVSKEVETKDSPNKAQLRDKIDAIAPKLEDAKSKLNELRARTDEPWEQLQAEMDRAMDALNKLCQELKDKGREVHLMSSTIYEFRRLTESWTGNLIDASCYNRDKSATCEPTDATTAFVLNVAGKTYKFDAGGNKKASEALTNRADRSEPARQQSEKVTATVQGTVTGETITVARIEVQ